MKRYSSGLYARLGFSVAIHSNPDIVLVDEVLSVGDASFRRRAMEALRSADRRRARRCCSSRTTCGTCGGCAAKSCGWRTAACAPTARRARSPSSYMNEVNLQAMQNQATSLQSHRGGTGEVRFEQRRSVRRRRRSDSRCFAAERHAGDSRRVHAPRSRSSRRSSRSRSSTSTPAWW